MASVFLFVFFLLSHLLLLLSAQKCPPFRCGLLGEIAFPFANNTNPECGVFTVDCLGPRLYPTIKLEVGGKERTYEVKEIINERNTIRIVDTELWEHLNSSKCKSLANLTFPSSSLFFFENFHNQTFFKCKRSTLNSPLPENLKNMSCVDDYNIYNTNSSNSVPSFLSECSIIQLPTTLMPGEDEWFAPLTAGSNLRVRAGFNLQVRVSDKCPLCYYGEGHCMPREKEKIYCKEECYKCFKKRGQCKQYYNGKLACVGGAEKDRNNKPLAIGLATLAFGIGVLVMMVVIYRFKAKFTSNKIIYFWKKESLNHQTVQAFLRNHGPLAIRRYNYSNIKKMTNFFKDKLGEGGYGSVYKGKLQDGCLVAVKVLKESRGNGDEFINEVASISRTSHVNIVSLMGFCFEGSKRALIYQFMHNGSLDKFIYKENALKNDRRLEWETLYKIALGIAQGLEYLHRGCNTQILHFDIKPHNILLDENFCPKISDFGLAKICPREKSIVSMLGARGTAGYIAPKVFCRNFGNVSHKSDVYSYGMMVFEMVGGRRNIDADIDHTSEIFFPHWIYKRLEQDEDLGLQSLMNEKDHESARKMIIISLWCIQSDPSIRPPMSSVVNMLEGSLESLQIPPKPFLSSPSRSPKDSSTTMGSLQYNSVMS